MAWTFLRPKRTRWLLVTAGAALASMIAWALAAWLAPWAPGRLGGLIAGSAAALVFLLDALYPLRRRLMAWPLGTAQHWLQFHIYGGVLAAVWVLIHMGFAWPAGLMGWGLFLLTLTAVTTGLAGAGLQKWAPATMGSRFTVEAIYERIPEMAARLATEADQLVAGTSEALQRFHATEVRPLLSGARFSWARVADVSGDLEQRRAAFKTVMPFLDAHERERLHDLEAIVVEHTQLEAGYVLQTLLRMWLVVHVPVSFVFLGLLAVHIAAVLIF